MATEHLQIVITTGKGDVRVFDNDVSAPPSDITQAVSEAMKAFNQTFTASLARAKRAHVRAFGKEKGAHKAA